MLKVDLRNAFNSIRRSACLEGIRRHCPGLVAWSSWCMGDTSLVFWGKRTLECKTGVQQGDPLGPLLFAAGIHDVIESLIGHDSFYQTWYLDDGLLVGPAPIIHELVSRMTTLLAAKGLQVNPDKCELYTAPGSSSSWTIPGIPTITNPDNWQYLGSPLNDKTTAAIASTISRVDQSTASTSALTKTHPASASPGNGGRLKSRILGSNNATLDDHHLSYCSLREWSSSFSPRHPRGFDSPS